MDRQAILHESKADSAAAHRGAAGIAALSAMASVGAVLAAASCCVLPLMLTALGFGIGLSSTFAVLMPLRWPLTAFSILGLTAGWWSHAQRWRACTADCPSTKLAPSRFVPAVLTIGTALTVIALAWDELEAPLMRMLF